MTHANPSLAKNKSPYSADDTRSPSLANKSPYSADKTPLMFTYLSPHAHSPVHYRDNAQRVCQDQPGQRRVEARLPPSDRHARRAKHNDHALQYVWLINKSFGQSIMIMPSSTCGSSTNLSAEHNDHALQYVSLINKSFVQSIMIIPGG
jgi:hypothetical protein